jgi:hypothetical protein
MMISPVFVIIIPFVVIPFLFFPKVIIVEVQSLTSAIAICNGVYRDFNGFLISRHPNRDLIQPCHYIVQTPLRAGLFRYVPIEVDDTLSEDLA